MSSAVAFEVLPLERDQGAAAVGTEGAHERVKRGDLRPAGTAARLVQVIVGADPLVGDDATVLDARLRRLRRSNRRLTVPAMAPTLWMMPRRTGRAPAPGP